MDNPKPRHKLSNVDLEHRTATCAVCGDIQIYVYKNAKLPRTQIRCLNKMRELNQVISYRLHEQRRLQNPNLKPRHKISQVDPGTMIGICSVCGPTKVRMQTTYDKKYSFYLCVQKMHADYKESHRKRYIPHPPTYKPSLVILAQQEKKRIIDRYKIEHGCKHCGYNTNPQGLELHFRDLPENEFTESKLIHFKRKRLYHILNICEVYCASCYLILNEEAAPIT